MKAVRQFIRRQWLLYKWDFRLNRLANEYAFAMRYGYEDYARELWWVNIHWSDLLHKDLVKF